MDDNHSFINNKRYQMDICTWYYRPGTNNSFWAKSSCDEQFKYLSKISNSENNERVGCADFYNGKECPVCGKPIQISYVVINDVR